MTESTVRKIERISTWALWVISPFAAIAIVGNAWNLATRGAVTAYLKSKGYA